MLTKEQFEKLPVGAMYVIINRMNGHRSYYTKMEGQRVVEERGELVVMSAVIKHLSNMELPTSDDLAEWLHRENERYLRLCTEIKKAYELSKEVQR